jgi:CRP/FNR family transcriptional regulator, anaerobic regulatory protein
VSVPSCAFSKTQLPQDHGSGRHSVSYPHHFSSLLQQVCGMRHVAAWPPPNHSGIAFHHMTLKARQYVYRMGQRFDYLFIVNSGFLKTVLLNENGIEQILSFPMKGDLLGVDGFHSGQYASEAIALSDCDIIMVPCKLLSALSKTYPELEEAICSAISQDLIQEQAAVCALTSLGVEARIARFLVSLAERFASMGYSGKLFNLRMTRKEIGRHLGINLETVCRTMSAFSALGWITVDKRTIGILDMQALTTLRQLPPPYSRPRKSPKRTEKAILADI